MTKDEQLEKIKQILISKGYKNFGLHSLAGDYELCASKSASADMKKWDASDYADIIVTFRMSWRDENYHSFEVINKKATGKGRVISCDSIDDIANAILSRGQISRRNKATEDENDFIKEKIKDACGRYFDSFDYFSSVDKWMVILRSEDEDIGEELRFKIDEQALHGMASNSYGAGYDDLPGAGSIHLGLSTYAEFSEMNGGDVYEDLDEDIRDRLVIFACSKQEWETWRRQNDY